MRRRDFVAGLGSVAVVPRPARAQQSKVYRIGFLLGGTSGNVASLFRSFKEGLRERGYIEGRNIEFVQRYAEGRMERLPDLAAELVRLKVDVIVTGSNQHVVAAQHATSTIPIVFIYTVDPVAAGFVASLARPGGNITGLTSDASPEFWARFLSLLLEVAPGISRIGALGTVSANVGFADLDEASRRLRLSIEVADVGRQEDIDGAFATLVSRQVEALVVVPGPLVYFLRQEIANAAIKNRLPAVITVKHFAQAGLLMSYGPDLEDEYRRSAVYVDKILKGAAPADLPVEQPSKFELVINLKTAKSLGVNIPVALLATADEVIE